MTARHKGSKTLLQSIATAILMAVSTRNTLAGTYNPTPAVTYADNWCGTTGCGNDVLENIWSDPSRVESAYFNDYSKGSEATDGGDCANFVSQCLISGGLGPDLTTFINSSQYIQTNAAGNEFSNGNEVTCADSNLTAYGIACGGFLGTINSAGTTLSYIPLKKFLTNSFHAQYTQGNAATIPSNLVAGDIVLFSDPAVMSLGVSAEIQRFSKPGADCRRSVKPALRPEKPGAVGKAVDLATAFKGSSRLAPRRGADLDESLGSFRSRRFPRFTNVRCEPPQHTRDERPSEFLFAMQALISPERLPACLPVGSSFLPEFQPAERLALPNGAELRSDEERELPDCKSNDRTPGGRVRQYHFVGKGCIQKNLEAVAILCGRGYGVVDDERPSLSYGDGGRLGATILFDGNAVDLEAVGESGGHNSGRELNACRINAAGGVVRKRKLNCAGVAGLGESLSLRGGFAAEQTDDRRGQKAASRYAVPVTEFLHTPLSFLTAKQLILQFSRRDLPRLRRAARLSGPVDSVNMEPRK